MNFGKNGGLPKCFFAYEKARMISFTGIYHAIKQVCQNLGVDHSCVDSYQKKQRVWDRVVFQCFANPARTKHPKANIAPNMALLARQPPE